MAIIKEIHFSRTKSFGVYENVRIGAVAEVVYPKTEDNVLVDLKEWVDGRISEEVSKPVVELKTEELKRLEADIESGIEILRGLRAEIKAKRRELDRCIEVGIRSLFEEKKFEPKPPMGEMGLDESGMGVLDWPLICPSCNKRVYIPLPPSEGWSKTCPWCGYRFPDTHYGKLWWWGKEVQPPDRDVSLNDTKAKAKEGC